MTELECDMCHDCQAQKKNEDVSGADSKEGSSVAEDKKMLTAQLIMESVAEHYGISVVQILSKNRSADIVNARYVTMYLCANMLHMPVDSIGVFVGNRDQSTVIHACKQIADEVESNS